MKLGLVKCRYAMHSRRLYRLSRRSKASSENMKQVFWVLWDLQGITITGAWRCICFLWTPGVKWTDSLAQRRGILTRCYDHTFRGTLCTVGCILCLGLRRATREMEHILCRFLTIVILDRIIGAASW